METDNHHDSSETPENIEAHAHPLQYFSHSAMACQFSIFFNQGQYPQCGDGAAECFELIDEIESVLTIYQSDSEISRLNRDANPDGFPLSEMTLAVLRTSRKISEQTRGAFDVTAGGLTTLWQDHRKRTSVPTPDEINSELQHVGTDQWEISADEQFIRSNSGVNLDLGAIGKGYALDQCTIRLRQLGIHDYLIHGGFSSVVARGDRFGESGWSVGIADPLVPEKRIGVFQLKNQSLGTSGTRRQGHFAQGKWHGHIVDPRTGQPASCNFSTTVITSISAEADALSTAFFVMNENEISKFCERHKNTKAIVAQAMGQGKYQLKLYNLSNDEIQNTQTG